MSKANPRYKRSNPSGTAVGTTNGVIEYVIRGKIEGQLTINTFYYSAAVPAPTSVQISTLSTNIHNALFTKWLAINSSDWSWTQDEIHVVHRNDIATFINPTGAGNPGTRGTPHLPTTCCVTINRVSTLKGQHGRGRFSIPTPAAADVTESTVTAAAYLTNITTFETAALATVSDGTNTWTPCIAQRSFVSPRLVTNFAPITTYQANLTVGSCRRRKLGKGK